jgi:hypothetical protein
VLDRFSRTILLCATRVLLLGGCGPDAEAPFAGLHSEQIETDREIGYRLRYMTPPWEPVRDDPLVLGAADARIQFGSEDRVGDDAQPDLQPVPESARVLEIARSTGAAAPAAEGVITYPKYRLEVALLDCEMLGLAPREDESCAAFLRERDESGRGATEDVGLLDADARVGTNVFGQRFHQFTTQVRDSRRYRRVVYFETAHRERAVRLGFEAFPSLAEHEVTQMIDAFEVFAKEEL